MTFEELAHNRYSVRSFTNKRIDKETLLKIVEAGRIAPSAVNFQPWHFIIAEEETTKLRIQASYPREWFKQAPVYIIVCADHTKAWTRNADNKNFADVDASIAADHIILQATELGLGTCWVCNFDIEKCKLALKLPDSIDPLVIMGYTEETIKKKDRKTLNEIVHWNSFSNH